MVCFAPGNNCLIRNPTRVLNANKKTACSTRDTLEPYRLKPKNRPGHPYEQNFPMRVWRTLFSLAVGSVAASGTDEHADGRRLQGCCSNTNRCPSSCRSSSYRTSYYNGVRTTTCSCSFCSSGCSGSSTPPPPPPPPPAPREDDKTPPTITLSGSACRGSEWCRRPPPLLLPAPRHTSPLPTPTAIAFLPVVTRVATPQFSVYLHTERPERSLRRRSHRSSRPAFTPRT